VVLPLPLLPVVLLPPVAPLLRRPRKRLRRRVSLPAGTHGLWAPGMRRLLTTVAEKEESDEDMGFGLFD
jgi:hypothetical protein